MWSLKFMTLPFEVYREELLSGVQAERKAKKQKQKNNLKEVSTAN